MSEDLVLEMSNAEPQKEEPTEVERLEEQELADILFGLVSTFNSLGEIDIMQLSKAKQTRVSVWKKKLWRSIDYYVNCLPYGDVPTAPLSVDEDE